MAHHFSNFVQKKSKLEFKIKDVDLSIVNSIRRIILSEVPTLGFYFDAYDHERKDINIISNTGVLHNEFISHRLSLIPLYFDEDEILDKATLDYKFVIKVKNTTNDVILITTKNFEIYDKNGKKQPEAFREHVFPKNDITGDHILITKLRPNLYDNTQGEELNVECIPTIGIAQQHARWCAVSQCCYHNTVDPVMSQKEFDKLTKDSTPEERKKQSVKFDITDKYRFFKKNKYDDPCEFEFTIDSECRLTPKQIFYTALDILQKKTKAFSENVGEFKTVNIGGLPNFYQLEIPNENFTLLNVLHCLIYNACYREMAVNPIEYIGYYQSHPLDNIMFLKVKFADPNTNIKEFMEKHALDIANYIQTLKDEWNVKK